MGTFEITRVGQSFQAAISASEGTPPVVRQFPTEDAARAWLINHLRMINLADMIQWLNKKPAYPIRFGRSDF
jgi:hypothetical protein